MSDAGAVATIPGWYGKLPTLGDFASRRLEADFIEPWDLWLGEGLQAQRHALGESWVETYLNSPPWRFLLAPGVLHGVDPDRIFAGVLVPSVDRVGRYFPITIAASLHRVPRVAAEFEALLAWLHRLEDTALDALQSDWNIDDLERSLAELTPPTDEAAVASENRLAVVRRGLAQAVAGGGGFVDIGAVANRFELASVFAGASAPVATMAASPALTANGMAFWMADVPGRPQLLVSRGLPSRDDFARMFSGGGAPASAGTAPRDTSAEGDPMATLPQDFDPLATLAQAFGAADDPLATLPQALSTPLLETEAHPGRGEGTDLLGMFEGTASPRGEDASGDGVRNDDILALFGVDAATPPVEGGPEPLPNDDILALFDAQSSSPSELEPRETKETEEGRPKERDILDLFGGPPIEPDPGKAH